MANEVFVSTQGDLLNASILQREMGLLFHQIPFMRAWCSYVGDVRGSGSDTIKTGQVNPADTAESVGENVTVTGNTAITDASFTNSPGRVTIKRKISELLKIVDSTGLQRELGLAQFNFTAIMRGFDALVATAIASFTGTVGTSGAAAEYAHFREAMQTFRTRRISGPKGALFYPHQWNQLSDDLIGVSNLDLESDHVAAAKGAMAGDNFEGFLDGVACATSTQVADANGGADHGGAIFRLPTGPIDLSAALQYSEGTPDAVTLGAGRLVMPGTKIYTDFDGDIDYANTSLVTNYFADVAIGQALAGIKFITDHE